METLSSDPFLVPQITSFVHSYMAGISIADDTGIEFYDYRDEKLRYRVTFKKAIKLIDYCQRYTDNPLTDLLDLETDTQDLHARKTAACQALSSLSLKKIQSIQVFLFHEHLKVVESQPQSPDHCAIQAVRFGNAKRFNDMMQIKAKNPGQNIINTIQQLIEKVKNLQTA
jgi:nitrate reductase alpha subunit